MRPNAKLYTLLNRLLQVRGGGGVGPPYYELWYDTAVF